MTTWTLWRALQQPPVYHPLYQRTLTASENPVQFSKRLIIPAIILILFYAFVLFVPIPSNAEVAFLIIGLIIPTLIVLLVFSGTGYGMLWAISISTAVTRQRETHTYDLLSVSPSGEFGIVWAISAGRLYRSGSFNRLESFEQLGQQNFIMYFIFIAALALNIISDGSEVFFALILIGVGLTMLYIDYVHSAVLSILIGIITPAHTDHTLTAQLYAGGVFVLLQVITYLMTVFVWTRLLPGLFDLINASNGIALTVQPLLTLAAFYGTRETMIWMVWRRINYRFEITLDDIDESQQTQSAI